MIRGLERAFALLQEVSPGIRLIGGLADNYRPMPPAPPVALPIDWLDRKLGRAVPPEEVRRILDPRHATKLATLTEALRELGQQLVIGVQAAA